MLDCLYTANRTSLAAHIQHLAALRQTVSDLDEEALKILDMRFLDLRTAYRNSLELQIHGLSELVEREAGRAEVLRRRIEDTTDDILVKEARIQDASALEQLLDRLNRNRIMGSTAPHKPNRE